MLKWYAITRFDLVEDYSDFISNEDIFLTCNMSVYKDIIEFNLHTRGYTWRLIYRPWFLITTRTNVNR